MNAENRNRMSSISFARAESLPVSVRALDRLADLMLDAEDVLELLQSDDAMGIRWARESVERVLDDVNVIMKRLSH
ncbi:MAG TPA: hypothetical protein VGD79_06405 [Thermoanaerobaculia bacterium]|jgi:hypothetical protein